MPSLERESNRIVIAGASSLLGAELKSLLEEGRFAGWEFRLVDEEIVAGTLTEAGGEPVVIQPVEEGSFEKARLVFFAGSPEFTRRNLKAAGGSGAIVIDLSGGIAGEAKTVTWFPKLDVLLGREFKKNAATYAIPSAAATAAATLALALSKSGARRPAIVFFQPVSEAGRGASKNWKAKLDSYSRFRGWDSQCSTRRSLSTWLTALGRRVRRSWMQSGSACE